MACFYFQWLNTGSYAVSGSALLPASTSMFSRCPDEGALANTHNKVFAKAPLHPRARSRPSAPIAATRTILNYTVSRQQ